MNLLESPEIPKDETAITERLKKEIHYSLDLTFRSVDGNFNVLPSSDRILTAEDVAKGFLSGQQKIDSSLARLLEGLPLQLHDPKIDMPPERRVAVEALIASKPTFVNLDKDKVDTTFVQAAEQFPNSQPGVILFPETGEIMNQFSAIKYSDGRMARLMQAKKREHLEDFVSRSNYLTPSLEAHTLNDDLDAYAMDFIEGAERPKSITQSEIDDWLIRVKRSGLIFGFDVGERDAGLDNLIRKDGKLFWVDGNILRATTATKEEDLDAFIESQRHTLKAFVRE